MSKHTRVVCVFISLSVFCVLFLSLYIFIYHSAYDPSVNSWDRSHPEGGTALSVASCLVCISASLTDKWQGFQMIIANGERQPWCLVTHTHTVWSRNLVTSLSALTQWLQISVRLNATFPGRLQDFTLENTNPPNVSWAPGMQKIWYTHRHKYTHTHTAQKCLIFLSTCLFWLLSNAFSLATSLLNSCVLCGQAITGCVWVPNLYLSLGKLYS